MSGAYRSVEGRAAVRRWCEARLAETPYRRDVVGTSLGPTHLLTAGAGDTTVLYLPGTNSCAATSLTSTAALADGRRVVVADVPGQPGLSAPQRPGRNGMAAYGRWVGEVIAHLDAGHLVLAGHSLGAAIALSADPARCDGLLLLDPAGVTRLHVGPAVLRATLPWLLRPTRRRSSALVQQMLAAARPPPPALVDWMTLVARHCRTTVAPKPLAPEVLRRWQQVPRAVLVGAGDCFLPAARLRAAVGTGLRTELQIVRDAGHLLPEERPNAVAAALAELLRPAAED